MIRYCSHLTDTQLMDLALRLGKRGAGQTAENPAVGCVIARHDNHGTHIVGYGWTQAGGRPHAERVALAQAGERAKGATAYVTLEPCSHHGKSPPCASALINAGIKRVVCAHPDPDPRVGGMGFNLLRGAGVDVSLGVLEARAHRDLAGFFSRITRKRPWVQAKMAISPDGYIGVKGQGNFPVTGIQAKMKTYGYRSRADAIMVGVDTILIDDPRLDVRTNGLEDRSPIRVVLDSQGRMPLDARLFQNAHEIPVWIITTGTIAADYALELEERGCRLLLAGQNKDGHVELSDALSLLGDEGINTVFVECGAKLSAALLKQSLIDEFLLYRGAKPIGEGGLEALGRSPEAALNAAGLEFETAQSMGADQLQIYVRAESLDEINGRDV